MPVIYIQTTNPFETGTAIVCGQRFEYVMCITIIQTCHNAEIFLRNSEPSASELLENLSSVLSTDTNI